MGCAADGGVCSGNLLVGGVVVHIDDSLVLVADVRHHGVNVDAQ